MRWRINRRQGSSPLGVDTEGIVDVAGAIAHRANDLTAEIKGVQSVLQKLFSLRHVLYTSHSLSG